MPATPASLSQKKCLHHGSREAVARCPECQRYFCRECITEHAGKVICQNCLDTLTREQSANEYAWGKTVGGWLGCAIGMLILWLSFNLLGQALLKIPTYFHDGTFWNQN